MDNQRPPRSYSTGTVKRDNRQQQQKMVVIMICIVIALLLVVFMTIIGTKIVMALIGGHQNADPSAVEYKNFTIENSQTLYGPLALVNDTHEYKFPGDAESALVNIWAYKSENTPENQGSAYKTLNTSIVMNKTALAAAHRWFSDFYQKTNLSNTTIITAHRTYEEQQGKEQDPGKSDHHTGNTIALKVVDNDGTFFLSEKPEYSWLTENAHKYGFVVRYPEDKADITGISGYSYCFRYVGDGPATYMKENNLCLEEFVAQIKAYSHNNPLKVTDANDRDWLIYYTACEGDMATVKLPTNFTYTVSGDNDGGIIVCVSLSKTDVQQQQQESESDTAAQ